MENQVKNGFDYYNGLNDGLFCCYNSLLVLMRATEKESSLNKVKLMIVHTVESMAEMMKETTNNFELMLQKGKETNELG